MNLHCILEVLSYLPINDLINVAKTSEFLAGCAEEAVEYFHKDKLEHIKVYETVDEMYHERIRLWLPYWLKPTIYTVDSFYQLFGHLVKSIQIINEANEVNEADSNQEKCLQVVANRQHNRLKHLMLRNFHLDLADVSDEDKHNLVGLLCKLDAITFHNSYIYGWKAADACLMKATSMHLEFDKSEMLKPFVHKYPKLQKMTISRAISKKMLRLNCHIQSLALNVDKLSKREIQTIRGLQHLTSLTLELADAPKDLSPLRDMQNLNHFAIAINTPLGCVNYISLFQALQNHQNLTEFMFDAVIRGTFGPDQQLSVAAYSKLEKLFLVTWSPFVSTLNIGNLIDITIKYGPNGGDINSPDNIYTVKRIINMLPKLARLNLLTIADSFKVVTLLQLQDLCLCRTNESNLVILAIADNIYEEAVAKAWQYTRTVLMIMYPLCGLTWATHYEFPSRGFENDAYGHALRISKEEEGCIRVKHKQFMENIPVFGYKFPADTAAEL